MTSPAERRQQLAELARLADVDVSALWDRAQGLDSPDFRALLISAYPELLDPYAAAAADLSATWYEDSDPQSDFIAKPGSLPVAEQLQQSASWALSATGTAALERLSGTLQRAIFDAARDTTTLNVEAERGARWARHASANACGFCRMLVTRHIGPNATFYSSEAAAAGVVGRGKDMSPAERRIRAAGGTRIDGRTAAGGRRTRGSRPLGEKYHDHCHCVAVEVRPGGDYEPPAYVEQWNEDYVAATRQSAKDGLTRGPYGAIDPKVIARLMNPK